MHFFSNKNYGILFLNVYLRIRLLYKQMYNTLFKLQQTKRNFIKLILDFTMVFFYVYKIITTNKSIKEK